MLTENNIKPSNNFEELSIETSVVPYSLFVAFATLPPKV